MDGSTFGVFNEGGEVQRDWLPALNIFGAKDVYETICCDFVSLEYHLVWVVFDSTDHAFASIHHLALLDALKGHLKTQQKIQNVLIPLTLILEKN